MDNLNKNITKCIVKFLKKEVKKRKAKKLIIGISGGIDSAVTAVLAVKSVGYQKVFGLIIPDYSVTPKTDVNDAVQLATWLKIDYKIIDVGDIKKQILLNAPKNKLADGNSLVRLRMIYLYHYAAVLGGIVVGTADKSELALGYFTKYGDGAVDLQPLGDVYKTEVRSLAKYFWIPDRILDKKSSARLWKGHTAEGELGLSYEDIDTILQKIEMKSQIKEPALKRKASIVKRLIERNAHKKEMPIICRIENK